MPYRFIENVAISDTAVEIWANDIESLFKDAADALENIMIDNPINIKNLEQIPLALDDISVEMLLFSLLQELIFIKDAKRLLCRIKDVKIGFSENTAHFRGTAYGEPINTDHHNLLVDVKAVTLHQFFVKKDNDIWRAQVIFDI